MKSIFIIFVAITSLIGTPVHALERVAATPYADSGSDLRSQLRLPTCTAGQVLTSLGANTFTCINVNSTLQTKHYRR